MPNVRLKRTRGQDWSNYMRLHLGELRKQRRLKGVKPGLGRNFEGRFSLKALFGEKIVMNYAVGERAITFNKSEFERVFPKKKKQQEIFAKAQEMGYEIVLV